MRENRFTRRLSESSDTSTDASLDGEYDANL